MRSSFLPYTSCSDSSVIRIFSVHPPGGTIRRPAAHNQFRGSSISDCLSSLERGPPHRPSPRSHSPDRRRSLRWRALRAIRQISPKVRDSIKARRLKLVCQQDSTRLSTTSTTVADVGDTRWRCTRTVKLRGFCSGTVGETSRTGKATSDLVRPVRLEIEHDRQCRVRSRYGSTRSILDGETRPAT